MGHRIAVMSDGVLQQIGTPQDVYRAPGERLRRDVPRRAADEPDRRRARVGRRRLALPRPGRRRAALDRGAQRARARARDRGDGATSSSACARSTSGSAPPGEDGGIPGRVRFLEPVGSDLYLTVEAGGTTVQVRTDPDSPREAGRQRHAALRRAGACTCSAPTATTCAATRRVASAAALVAGRARSAMAARAAVVDAVAASEAGLQGLLRDLIAFRTESQAKEATHFPDEARRCIGFVSDFLSGARVRARGLGRRPVGDVPGASADRRARGRARAAAARSRSTRTSTSCRSATAARGRRSRSAARSSTAASTGAARPT